MESWQKIKKLGQGSFGLVFLATNKSSSSSSKRFVAVKSIDCSAQFAVASLREEARILGQLIGTPNVVQCYGEDFSIENGRKIYNLLLDYAPGGSLHDLICNTYSGGKTLPEPLVALYSSMLLKALAGIHSKGIVHCDLKPENVLIFPTLCGGRHINMLKLADFGSARRLSEEEQLVETDSGGTKTYTKTTLPYASPESVSSGVHGTGTDIWSFGCIVIEMITGQRAYNYRDNDDLVHQILHGCIFVPGRLSNMDGVDFLMRCFDRDPKYRWSALKLLNHPFIVNNLKMMSQIHGVDYSKIEDTNYSQKNPFGRLDWVTKQHLFSKGQQQQQPLVHHHHHQEEARRQKRLQFHQPYVRLPVQNSHQLPGPTALNHCLRV